VLVFSDFLVFTNTITFHEHDFLVAAAAGGGGVGSVVAGSSLAKYRQLFFDGFAGTFGASYFPPRDSTMVSNLCSQRRQVNSKIGINPRFTRNFRFQITTSDPSQSEIWNPVGLGALGFCFSLFGGFA
jgi:hypothetical protein